ncbi:MAG: HAMP domain-containing protein, partial [Gemmatimonas sp.]|nr:HAMP domain-containing protein [Gemmatimonas sp.]
MGLRADQHLFLSYLLLIALLTVAMSVGADSLLRRQLLATIEADLRRELVLGRALYDGSPETSADAIAGQIAALSGRRVTIVAREGRVVGESGVSDGEAPRADDYRVRPEIREAIERGEGRAIRYSNALRADHLYIASMAERGDVIRLAVPLSEINQALSQVQRGIFGVGIVAVLLAALFSLGFSIAVTGPLRRIGDAARTLASGDLSRRITVLRPTELRELGLALNSLADELQKRIAQLEGERAEMHALIDSMSEGVLAVAPNGTLRRANPAAQRIFALMPQAGLLSPEMVSRRPEFLRIVNIALEGETVPPRELVIGGTSLIATAHPLPDGGAVLVFLDVSELRRLEGVRRDFVANVSHELKTPLTAIRGYSETLLDPDLPLELRGRFAEIVRLNAERLQRIVDDLLDLSRIESGGLDIEPSWVPIDRMAQEVWRSQVAEQKDVELVIDLAEVHERVWVDAEAIRQVLSNLISNAVRYTPQRGRVTLRTRPGSSEPRRGSVDGSRAAARSRTVLEVEDTGSGIPAAHLSRIFERFYRADPARSREEGGTGL